MYEASGRQWCVRFPSSARVADLEQTFALKAATFLNMLTAAKNRKQFNVRNG